MACNLCKGVGPVVAMCVNNPDRSPLRINGRHPVAAVGKGHALLLDPARLPARGTANQSQ